MAHGTPFALDRTYIQLSDGAAAMPVPTATIAAPGDLLSITRGAGTEVRG